MFLTYASVISELVEKWASMISNRQNMKKQRFIYSSLDKMKKQTNNGLLLWEDTQK